MRSSGSSVPVPQSETPGCRIDPEATSVNLATNAGIDFAVPFGRESDVRSGFEPLGVLPLSPPRVSPLLRRIPLLALVGAWSFAARAQDGAPVAPATPDRPNVVLILMDDLAPAATGAEGDPRARTPVADRVAAEGARFSRAYAATPSRVNARYALLTGRPPAANGSSLIGTKLHQGQITLAEVLRFHGMRTFCAGDLLEEHDTVPFDETVSRRIAQPEGIPRPVAPLPAGIAVREPWNPFEDPLAARLNASFLPVPLAFEETPEVFLARRAAEFVRRPHDRPFFLCVALRSPFAPHEFPVEYRDLVAPEDFEPPPALDPDDPADAADLRDLPLGQLGLTDADRRRTLATHHAAKAFLEDCRAIVLDAIDQAGIADRTLVVLAGETGSMRGEHGRFEQGCLHEGAIRVFLAMRQPGRIPPGVVLDGPIEATDVAPTILQLAGVPAWHRIEGRGFAPVVLGAVPPDPATGAVPPVRADALTVDHEGGAAALIEGDWKLVHVSGRRARRDLYRTADGAAPPRSTRLFDLASDPGERVDLAPLPEHADRLARMKARLLERLLEVPAPPPMPPDADIDTRLEYALLPPETLARVATELGFARP